MTEERYQQIRASSIRQRLAFVARDSILYGSAAALSSLVGLLLLPFLTRLFTTPEYGALDSMNVLGAAFVAFIIMGQDSSIARYFYETDDPEERRQIVSQGLVTELMIGSFVTCGVWTFASQILERVYGIAEYHDVFRILVSAFPFIVVTRFCSNLLKWTFARYQFILVSFGSSVAVILITLFNVLVLKLGMRGVYFGQMIGFGSFSLLGLWFCRKHFDMPRNFAYGREMLSYGGPYMVTSVAGCLIPALDRVLITNVQGLDATGLYAIGYRYAFMLMLPIQAFIAAWVPFALSIYKESNASETYNRGLLLITVALSSLAVVMISGVEPIVQLVASERYLPGHVVALPLMLGLIAQNISHVAGLGIALSKRTRFTMYGYVIGVLSSATFIWLLVGRFGILGAACGAMLGRLAQSLAYVGFAYYAYPLRFALTRPVTVVVLAAVAGLTIQVVEIPALPLLAGFRALVVVVFFVLTWFAMFDRDEREKAGAMLRGYLGRASSET